MATDTLWDTVYRNLSRFMKLVRIEDRYVSGYPDVLWLLRGRTGWWELKNVPAWPVRPATPLRISHLEPEQVAFLLDWERHGGSAGLLLRVGLDYLLLSPGSTKLLADGQLCRSDCYARALVWKRGAFPTKELLRAVLQKGNNISNNSMD